MSVKQHRSTQPFRPSILAASLAAALVALAAAPAEAALVQITQNTRSNTFGPSISADGRHIAFYSAANITGGNADGSFEIHVYDRSTATFAQISNHAGGGLTGGHQVPHISADGQRVVYQSFTVTGTTASFQTVLHDRGTGLTRVLTPPAGAGETNGFSGDGNTVAIATGNTGLRLYDVASDTLGPVIAGNTFHNALSFDGQVLASEGFGRLDVLDRSTGAWQVIAPSGSGFNMRPDLSDDGRWLAFTSTYNPLGTNADRNSEVFLYDLHNDSVRQLTQSSGGSSSAQVSLSGDGSRLAFASTADLLGTNADGNLEIFLLDLFDDTLTQVTQSIGSGSFNVEPALSGDGRTLAFISAANLTGHNAVGLPQLFVADLAPRVGGVPVPGTLPLLALAGGMLVMGGRRHVARPAGGAGRGPQAAVHGVESPTGVIAVAT